MSDTRPFTAVSASELSRTLAAASAHRGPQTGKLPAVIVDVDGTLVDVSGVRHYVLADPHRKDFTAFHAGAALCPPHAHIVRLVQDLARIGVAPIIVTARKQRWEFLTLQWLRKWHVPWVEFHMRGDADDRRDVLVKEDILDDVLERYDVMLAIDDNPAVVELWERRDIATLVVPGWITPEGA